MGCKATTNVFDNAWVVLFNDCMNVVSVWCGETDVNLHIVSADNTVSECVYTWSYEEKPTSVVQVMEDMRNFMRGESANVQCRE